MELLREIKLAYPNTAVIMATALDDASIAIEAMRLGASDYVVKPLDLGALLMTVERALETRRMVLETRQQRTRLEKNVESRIGEIRGSAIETLKSMAREINDRDPYWRGHVRRSLVLAEALAVELSVPADIMDSFRLGMELQDVGKVMVREEVLHKAGPLTQEEYKHVVDHSQQGAELVSSLIDDTHVVDLIRYHHHHWNGGKVFSGLKGPQIPVLARIAAVANSFVAMTSPRPYRPALDIAEAKRQVGEGSGTVFDPQIVAAFMRLPEAVLLSAASSIGDSQG